MCRTVSWRSDDGLNPSSQISHMKLGSWQFNHNNDQNYENKTLRMKKAAFQSNISMNYEAMRNIPFVQFGFQASEDWATWTNNEETRVTMFSDLLLSDRSCNKRAIRDGGLTVRQIVVPLKEGAPGGSVTTFRPGSSARNLLLTFLRWEQATNNRKTTRQPVSTRI